MDMTKIFILGAGCSKNYSQGTTNIPGLKCPVDRDFFAMAKKVIINKITDPLFDAQLNHLLKDINEMFGSQDNDGLSVLDIPNLSLEKVMTEIAIQGTLFDKPIYRYGWKYATDLTVSRRMSTFIELISRTIEEALKGDVCEKHKALADLIDQNDTVISYNYDLLIDKALRSKTKLTDEGYRLSFYRTYQDGGWSRPDSEGSSVSLLKLHGSLNWLRCRICDSVLLWRSEKVSIWPTVSCPKCGAQGETMERVLIPPLLVKDYGEPAINYLWFEAVGALHRADEIIVIGYSLPPTDFASETLLLSGLGQRRKEVPVTIVNPDPSVRKRFSEIFAERNINYMPTLEEFLRS
jgi:NAD-dependent SIR2 family protein deacetylase